MHAYEKTVEDQALSSRADVSNVVRNDLRYRTPPEIEATVLKAISGAQVTVTTSDGTPVSKSGGMTPSGLSVTPAAAGLNAKATIIPSQ